MVFLWFSYGMEWLTLKFCLQTMPGATKIPSEPGSVVKTSWASRPGPGSPHGRCF